MRVDESVQHEDAVASVVHRPPEHRRGVVQLPEDTAADYEHQVVEDSQCHERQPLKQGSQEVMATESNEDGLSVMVNFYELLEKLALRMTFTVVLKTGSTKYE